MTTAFDTEKLTCKPENVAKFKDWLQNRGGIAVWVSQRIGDGQTWSAPALNLDGTPHEPDIWQLRGSKPVRICTDPADVQVCVDVEVKRFHVAVRMGSQGMSLKLTDASTAKVRREVAKAGDGAYYVFDYGDYKNCIIMRPDKAVPLSEWKEEPSGADALQGGQGK